MRSDQGIPAGQREPPAMRGDQDNMFGAAKNARRLANTAFAQADGSVAKATADLEAQKQRLIDRYRAGEFGATWAMGQTIPGMTRGEAVRNFQQVAQDFVGRMSEKIDYAISLLQGSPRAMRGSQSDMFAEDLSKLSDEDLRKTLLQRGYGEEQATKAIAELKEKWAAKETARPQKEQKERGVAPVTSEAQAVADLEAADLENFGAPVNEEAAGGIEGEGVVSQELGDQKGPRDRAPKPGDDREHILDTVEGKQIVGFFDTIQSANQTPEGVKDHGYPKNVAAETLLTYDITKPGETTTSSMKKMLKYLTASVGGVASFKALMDSLNSAAPEARGDLFVRAGLPDLTTRRGMATFSKSVQEYVSDLGGSGAGFSVDRRAESGIHIERFTTPTEGTQVFGPTVEGKPREPDTTMTETEHVIVDSKLYGVWLAIKAARKAGGKLSDGMRAAIAYTSNPTNRKAFSDVLTAVAYDIAYEISAGSNFSGEGSVAANHFRDFVKTNLSPSTLATLDEMIEQYKQSAKANKVHREAVDTYDAALKVYVQKMRKEGKAAVQLAKEQEKIARRKPTKRVGETEETESEPTPAIAVDYRKNLPTDEILVTSHPDVIRELKTGTVRGALEMLTRMKGNPYYARLAQRLLDTGFESKSRFVTVDTMESVSNDPKYGKVLEERIKEVSELITALYPKNQQGALRAGLNSGKLRNVLDVMAELKALTNAGESNQLVFDSLLDLVRAQYVWDGKYDPVTDTIVMREGAGTLTTHLLFHETIHAAASHLIDNYKTLSGLQKQGYDQLVKLFRHAKMKALEEGVEFYGLSDLNDALPHEFVSEALSNPVFQAWLRSVPYESTPFSYLSRFTESIRKLFNVGQGPESNVMAEAMFAADAMMSGTGSVDGLTTTGPFAMAAGKGRPKIPPGNVPGGMPNQLSTRKRLMKMVLRGASWEDGKREWRNLAAAQRPYFLALITLRQVDDLVRGRIPQLTNFIRVVEQFQARKSNIIADADKISRKLELLQSEDASMMRKMAAVAHTASILEVDPAKASVTQRNANVQLMQDWDALTPTAQALYREVRDFYRRRYIDYRRLMNKRFAQMEQAGVSKPTILKLRAEFETGRLKGPWFPLMRHGPFAYQIGTGKNREYYMFESLGAREVHLNERIKRSPLLDGTQVTFNDYAKQVDPHARESAFIADIFDAVDSMDFAGLNLVDADARKTELKDTFYQTYLQNQPERSMRNQFIHRNNIEGFSQDIVRNFATAASNMAYQLARLEYSPEMFSQLDAARAHVNRRTPASNKYDPALAAENDELRDFVKSADWRLRNAILNPVDTGPLVSAFSNIGFIFYLTSMASAATNMLSGAILGLPTLVGQQIRANPKMGYTRAAAMVTWEVTRTMAEIAATGVWAEFGGRIRDSRLLTPSLERSKLLSPTVAAAYKRFAADGVIDITQTYDISGLASKPSEDYSSIPNKAMQVLAYAFHHTERIQREIMSISSFRMAMKNRAKNKDQQQAIEESIADAKTATYMALGNYSTANKPPVMQSAVARVILQFQQWPQYVTFFLSRNVYNSFRGLTVTDRREARARFVGVMGMTALASGITGLWGFSTVASIIEAVFNYGLEEDDEDWMDVELEFMNFLVNANKYLGMLAGRGVGNMLGVDLHSKLKLDNMWFRDPRANMDAKATTMDALVKALGPHAGIAMSAAKAVDLYNAGHGDRALEAVLPSVFRQPATAYRFGKEGAKNLAGDPLVEEFTPFELAMRGIGFSTTELAELQFRNIKKKSQAEGIDKKRTQVLNYFGLTFLSNDVDGTEEAIEQIIKFNDRHPTKAIDVDGIISSIEKKLEKSALTDSGLYIDPKLRHIVTQDYVDKLKKPPKPPAKEQNWWEAAPLAK